MAIFALKGAKIPDFGSDLGQFLAASAGWEVIGLGAYANSLEANLRSTEYA